MPTHHPKLVKQGELEHVLTLRLEVETLKRQLKRVESDLSVAETLVVHAVDEGRQVERGPLAAGINEEAGRRVPKWKEEFARACGAEAVERVIQATEPGPGQRKLVILRGGQLVKSALAGLAIILALWALPATAQDWNSSPDNWANSPNNWQNSSGNWKNSPNNWDNSRSRYGNDRILRDNDGRPWGYQVPRRDGGANIYDFNGNRRGYRPGR